MYNRFFVIKFAWFVKCSLPFVLVAVANHTRAKFWWLSQIPLLISDTIYTDLYLFQVSSLRITHRRWYNNVYHILVQGKHRACSSKSEVGVVKQTEELIKQNAVEPVLKDHSFDRENVFFFQGKCGL